MWSTSISPEPKPDGSQNLSRHQRGGDRPGARLVVDSGLNAMRWSREKAIDTMSAIDGSPTSSAATEIERYCIRPGQACAYRVGKLTWLRLRGQAHAALGPRFDIRKFHDAVLLSGAMPLTVLERHVQAWVATQT